MTEYKLNIGDVASSASRARYMCYGLGSCVGLFISDRITGASAAAHILLPNADLCAEEDLSKHYNVHSAFAEMLKRLKMMGSNLTSLRAKVAGGANVMSMNLQTGALNVESVLRQLTEHKIYIAATDVGGTHCRTASFESETGQLTVKIPQTNHLRIL